MSPDPQRFAQVVLAAFKDAGLHTLKAIEAAKGPSSTNVSLLRKVAKGEETMSEPREPTWSKIEKAAKWEPGSARRVWNGGEPTPVGGDAQDVGYVASPGERTVQTISNEDLMRELMRNRAEYDQLRAEVRTLSERVDRIEPRS